MHFRLDFGKAFGGSFTAKGVRLWLDPFIRETLTEMIVWPNRIVVPILPEEQAGPLDHLYLRCALMPNARSCSGLSSGHAKMSTLHISCISASSCHESCWEQDSLALVPVEHDTRPADWPSLCHAHAFKKHLRVHRARLHTGM